MCCCTYWNCSGSGLCRDICQHFKWIRIFFLNHCKFTFATWAIGSFSPGSKPAPSTRPPVGSVVMILPVSASNTTISLFCCTEEAMILSVESKTTWSFTRTYRPRLFYLPGLHIDHTDFTLVFNIHKHFPLSIAYCCLRFSCHTMVCITLSVLAINNSGIRWTSVQVIIDLVNGS